MILKTNKTEDESTVPIDDQMQPATDVLFDVFYFGDDFSHHQLTTAKQERVIDGHSVSYDGQKVLLDNKPFEKNNPKFIIVKPTDYQTITTNKPKKDFTISSRASSAISLPTAAFISVSVEPKTNRYSMDIYANKEAIYFNGKQVVKGTFDFNTGDQLVIDKLIIEVREKQLKVTNLGSDFKLNPFEIIEQSYEPEYPSEFPLFRRSPRIHLKEPKMEVEVTTPTPKEKEGKNELLRTLVPPLGMVVLSGATSFLSGGNPIMMLSMGGASLLTAGFSVSSYFTNKKETKEKNERSEGSYRQYLIQKKGDISLLQQEQEHALTYMYPSMNDLALMAKDYQARIYERMTTNEDFLKVHVGAGEIKSSFSVRYQPNEESELSSLAEKQLVWPYQQLEAAPIVIPLMDQTVGLAGNYPVLRTAVQTLLFQISMLHSYRDVEFVTLVPENDYDTNWHAWRWLPHLKIRSLNLRGIIHNAQTRDMVLNSFYQILTKRRQELKENSNEKIRFQPHYVFSILEESWLSGHGLNEFLAEDMSPYGVTVIWGKDALPMLPETTTTLIDYQSSEAAILINQNNEYVNQAFVPTHLPTAYPIEEALQRLANLHHVEVEKNAVPESLDLLEQYEVKRIEELQINNRWLEAEPNKSIRSLIGWRGKSDYVYWDLHERAHGPHALVGGTTGSGKSEFLTTYLIGLAINFSPEDIGMLIIDWKGGGIANTLDKLPHFMGAITNLDGAGTARALASIKAELNKRQREFAKYGVNNINGYMSLYKQRHTPKEDIIYPEKPLPHLILVSDEFAELKANVPEFLDELTSVARIGRSLGVHLILATQKPSGVVNDQIEANSTSKIALKMASVQDSNELLKTPDAAQITNPGRGYLKVGENEVYELFQSGYAGVLYDPDKTMEEVVDERIFKINDLGQTELLYDPDENIVQGKDTSDLPTQLEAVIETIGQIFEQSEFTIPDKPWLPNLSEQITTPTIEEAKQRNVTIPLGLLDIPSEQAQKVYHYNLEKASHTAIFSSPGYGKSTLLQTLTMNLARQNTPEQVQFNLLDFGNNGLLPLKDLPHIADIVTLEEDEKLQKMLDRISDLLAERKGSFKKNGVASIVQYEAKTQSKLPIVINILDGYDGLSVEDNRKDKIDEVLLQLLRDGASLGVYLIMTASRSGSIRMNMMGNIATKIALYLNDETELSTLLGRETLAAQAINGRGQVMLDIPTSVQFYLPIEGENSSDVLENLEKEVTRMDQDWTGERPEKIPMVPEELTIQNFVSFVKERENNNLYLGLNKLSSLVEKFPIFQGKTLGIFTSSNKQFRLMMPWIMQQINEWKEENDIILIDAAGTLEEKATYVSTYIDRMKVTQQNYELKESLEAMLLNDSSQRIVIINGIAELVDKLFLNPEEVAFLLNGGNDHLQLLFIDSLTKVGNTYGGLTNMVKESVYQILFGGSLQNQLFIENLPYTQKNVVVPRNVLHSLKDDLFEDIVIPMEVGE
ncbi:type VII secretion protein EssC [Candidatus Enterococcus ikei]|uniref:Type VII secretion protein EssC n=1 Tax=Candidatus Enterococcus ikei TaxID=2815326 RepID=A0ABS3GYF3_9ENTE|nr:type VII secretion protein EssC [Enterococcus sp. DIV0869a]MBO0440291.1 type VII secretion protein EssC [Enterococcus sp. DIV0869a]